MQALADIQAEFTGALRDPHRLAPATLAAAGRGDPDGFNVYRNNRVSSLVDALGATYPAVQRLVGEAFFRVAARLYVDRHPPRSPVLHHYGADFDRFLDGFPPAAQVPYLGDIARLEWSCLRAYHAADADPVGIAELAALPLPATPRARLTLHPSLAVHRSRWPAGSLRTVLCGAGDSPDIDMRRGEDVLVVRPALCVDVRVLPGGAHPFISALADGGSIEQAAVRAQAECHEFDLTIQLQGLFDVGAVVAVRPPKEDHP